MGRVIVIPKKSCILALLLLLLALAAMAARGAGPTLTMAQQGRLVPIYYVDTPEKKIAFSFDASWDDETLLHNYSVNYIC